MPQAMMSTTMVRSAVARFELTPSIPTFAKMEVSAANNADNNAKTSHKLLVMIFFMFFYL